MRARLLLSASVLALVLSGPGRAQQVDLQIEQQFAAQYALSAGDLTASTIQLLKEKLSAEQKAKDAESNVASAQASVASTAQQLANAQADQAKKYQALVDAGLKIVTSPDGKVTTDTQAAREAALRQATNLMRQYDTAYQEALLESQIAAKNPSAYTPQQRAEIESRMKSAFEHRTQAEQAAIHVAEQIDRQALTLLQDYNGTVDKTKAAVAANDQAKSALTSATNAVTVSKTMTQDVDVLLKAKAIADADAKKARDDVARTAAAAGKYPPASVLNTVGGATNLNVINLASTLANGTIKVSDLTPEQKAAIVAQGGGNIVAQGAGNIRIADLTPAMLLGIVATGGGNIVAQGGGNIVATGGGNIVAQGAGNLAQLAAALGIVAQGAGNIVAQGAGNIVAQGAGNIVAQGAGNLGQIATAALANVKQVETALLTVGLANSIITNDGASLIGRQVAQGLITNDGGSLITNDGGSLITNDGGSLVGKSAVQLAASAASLIDNAKVASFISTNGGGIVAQGAGNIVAQGAGNIVAQGAGNIVATGGGNIVATGGGNIVATGGGNLAAQSGIRAFQGTTESGAAPQSSQASAVTAPALPSPVTSLPAGGGFKHETTISVSSSAVDQKTGKVVSTNSMPTTTVATAPTTTPTTTTAAPTRPYDPNDWTTWPQKSVQEFLPPGKTVEQFKSSAENDLGNYQRYVAALAAHGTLTPEQQSQKAGMEAQIQSLQFQIDAANRALGLSTAASTSASTAVATAAAPAAPAAPVMSAAAIAATVTLKTNLTDAQAQVDGRLQQIASANQGLAELQAQRAKTTDPAALKGIDDAITSAKFQIDVMQQSLARENKQVADLQAAAAAAAPAGGTQAAPVKLSAEQNTAVQKSLRTIPGKLSSAEKRQFDRLSTLADRATHNGLTGDDATALKSGIAALRARHPHAASRYHLDQVHAATSGIEPGAAGKTSQRNEASLPVRAVDPQNGAAPKPHRETLREASRPELKSASGSHQSAPNAKPDHDTHPAGARQPVRPAAASRAAATTPVTAPGSAPHRRSPDAVKTPSAPKPVAVSRPTAPPPSAPKVAAPPPPKPVAPTPSIAAPRR